MKWGKSGASAGTRYRYAALGKQTLWHSDLQHETSEYPKPCVEDNHLGHSRADTMMDIRVRS